MWLLYRIYVALTGRLSYNSHVDPVTATRKPSPTCAILQTFPYVAVYNYYWTALREGATAALRGFTGRLKGII